MAVELAIGEARTKRSTGKRWRCSTWSESRCRSLRAKEAAEHHRAFYSPEPLPPSALESALRPCCRTQARDRRGCCRASAYRSCEPPLPSARCQEHNRDRRCLLPPSLFLFLLSSPLCSTPSRRSRALQSRRRCCRSQALSPCSASLSMSALFSLPPPLSLSRTTQFWVLSQLGRKIGSAFTYSIGGCFFPVDDAFWV